MLGPSSTFSFIFYVRAILTKDAAWVRQSETNKSGDEKKWTKEGKAGGSVLLGRMKTRLRGTTRGMFLYMYVSNFHGFQKVIRHPQRRKTEIGSSKSKEVNSIYLCSRKNTRLSLNLDRSAKSPPSPRSKNYRTRIRTLRWKISVILTVILKCCANVTAL